MSQATESLRQELTDELKSQLNINFNLPNPPPELLEMQHILQSQNFKFEPIVYLNNQQAIFALLDRSVRPHSSSKTHGLMSRFVAIHGLEPLEGDDGYAPILKKLRQDGVIERASFSFNEYGEGFEWLPEGTRFGLSWDQIHNFVTPAVTNQSPELAQLIRITRAKVRLPSKKEFQFAGKLRYAHFGEANSYEWLFDKAPGWWNAMCFPGPRLVGGCLDMRDVNPSGDIIRSGLRNFGPQPMGIAVQENRTWFRQQVVLPSQKVDLSDRLLPSLPTIQGS